MKPQIQSREFITLDTLGNAIKVLVRHSTKAKRVAIKIGLSGAELIVPSGIFSQDIGYKFLIEKELWIRQKLKYLLTQAPIDKTTIPLLGKIYSLHYIEADNTDILIKNDTLYIYSLPNQQEDVLKRFLKNKLLEEIKLLTIFFKEKYNLIFTSIKIMDSKSKWGSCSCKAALSFNWRLVFAPPEILKYLVVHEMCHIAEMNHSHKFWRLVKEIYPDYKAAKLWLKENSYRLHQYLLSPVNIEDKLNMHRRLQQELLLK